MTITPQLAKAIDETLAQVRAELIRLYLDKDVGTVVVHCGKKQMRVKATPERTQAAVTVAE